MTAEQRHLPKCFSDASGSYGADAWRLRVGLGGRRNRKLRLEPWPEDRAIRAQGDSSALAIALNWLRLRWELPLFLSIAPVTSLNITQCMWWCHASTERQASAWEEIDARRLLFGIVCMIYSDLTKCRCNVLSGSIDCSMCFKDDCLAFHSWRSSSLVERCLNSLKEPRIGYSLKLNQSNLHDKPKLRY